MLELIFGHSDDRQEVRFVRRRDDRTLWNLVSGQSILR